MHSNRSHNQQEEPEPPRVQAQPKSQTKRTGPTRVRLHNRISAVMLHLSRYSFEGQARLAADLGVSRSTISRFLRGHTLPSYALVEAVARALSVRLGKPLSPRDLVSFDGTYPTASTCALVGCRGCLPEQAYDGDGRLLPAWQGATPGDWSRFPEWHMPGMPALQTPGTELRRTDLANKIRTEERLASAPIYAAS